MGMAKPILLRRLRNEFRAIGDLLAISVPDVPDDISFPYEVRLHIRGAKGYSSPGKEVEEHDFLLIFGDDYPYERPKVKWLSPIFHPNIMSPEEGGLVCVMGIDHWDFDSDLAVFVRDLTELVNNPNPDNPLNSESCMAAAKWFSEEA